MKFLLKTKLIFLTAINLSSCAYSPKDLTPNFIDTDRKTCREYKVVQVRPTVEFVFDKEYPIAHCNGFISLPIKQALEIKREYEESIHGQALLPAPADFEGKIAYELEALGGIALKEDAQITEIKVDDGNDRGTQQEKPSNRFDH